MIFEKLVKGDADDGGLKEQVLELVEGASEREILEILEALSELLEKS
jgi:hypothetical protein